MEFACGEHHVKNEKSFALVIVHNDYFFEVMASFFALAKDFFVVILLLTLSLSHLAACVPVFLRLSSLLALVEKVSVFASQCVIDQQISLEYLDFLNVPYANPFHRRLAFVQALFPFEVFHSLCDVSIVI